MIKLKQQYILDNKGQKIAVIIPISEYKRMLEQIEKYEDINLYDKVKNKNEATIPFNEYQKMRNQNRL